MNFKDYILKTPSTLNNLANVKLDNNLTKDSKVILLGIGSSLNACHLVAKLANHYQNSDNIYSLNAAEFYYHHKIKSDAVYIIVSQSGRSKIAINCYHKISKSNPNVIFVTAQGEKNELNYVKKHEEIPMELETVDFKSLGYTMAIYYLLKKLNVSWEIDELSANQDWLNKIINLDFKIDVQKLKKIHFIGEWYSYDLFQEGGLKTVEMLNIDSSVSEIEDYIHGRYLDSTDNTLFVINSHSQKENKELIIEYLKSKKAMIIDMNKYLNETNLFYNQILKEIWFIQVLLNNLVEKKGMSLTTLSAESLVNTSKS